MSRLAKKTIVIPDGTKICVNKFVINVFGPKGELSCVLHKFIEIDIQKDLLYVKHNLKFDCNKALLGTTYVLLFNMIKGVNVGYIKKLLLKGVGYKAKVDKNFLELFLGFSHSVIYVIPFGINIEVINNIEIVISGICKEKVGQIAADIRSKKEPEIYKGKGIRYFDEIVLLKETKKK